MAVLLALSSRSDGIGLSQVGGANLEGRKVQAVSGDLAMSEAYTLILLHIYASSCHLCQSGLLCGRVSKCEVFDVLHHSYACLGGCRRNFRGECISLELTVDDS